MEKTRSTYKNVNILKFFTCPKVRVLKGLGINSRHQTTKHMHDVHRSHTHDNGLHELKEMELLITSHLTM